MNVYLVSEFSKVLVTYVTSLSVVTEYAFWLVLTGRGNRLVSHFYKGDVRFGRNPNKYPNSLKTATYNEQHNNTPKSEVNTRVNTSSFVMINTNLVYINMFSSLF